MIGPVFHLELLHGSRRSRQRLFRHAYVALLLVEFLVLYAMYLVRTMLPLSGGAGRIADWTAADDFLQRLLALFVIQQFALLLLTVPAFAAGSISDEKTSGTLQGLLITGLGARDIILGKYLAQVCRVMELAVAGWPVLAFLCLLGGLEPGFAAAIALSPLPPLLALAAASILASVWCRSTSGAVLTVYGVGAVLVVPLASFGFWPEFLDPWSFLEPVAEGSGPTTATRWLGAWLGWGLTAGICLAVAAWQLRPRYVRQLVADSACKRRGGVLTRPPVTDMPVRWKERFVARPVLRWLPRGVLAASLALLSVLLAAGLFLTHLLAVVTLEELVTLLWHGEWSQLARMAALAEPVGFAFHGLGLAVALGTGLVMGIRCSGTVSGERERKTWEGLLLTPLEPNQLIRGKLWGAIDAFRPYLLAWWLPALVLSALGGVWAAAWSAFWWAGTWVLMYFFAASAIQHSVSSSSSWRSLLGTLVASCRGLLTRYLFFGLPLGALTSLAFMMVLGLAGWLLGLSSAPMWRAFWRDHLTEMFLVGPYVLTGISIFAAAEALLEQAEKQVAVEERIPQGAEADRFRFRKMPDWEKQGAGRAQAR